MKNIKNIQQDTIIFLQILYPSNHPKIHQPGGIATFAWFGITLNESRRQDRIEVGYPAWASPARTITESLGARPAGSEQARVEAEEKRVGVNVSNDIEKATQVWGSRIIEAESCHVVDPPVRLHAEHFYRNQRCEARFNSRKIQPPCTHIHSLQSSDYQEESRQTQEKQETVQGESFRAFNKTQTVLHSRDLLDPDARLRRTDTYDSHLRVARDRRNSPGHGYLRATKWAGIVNKYYRGTMFIHRLAYLNSFLQETRGNASDDGKRLDVGCYDTTCSNDCTLTNLHTGEDCRIRADPNIVSNDHTDLVGARGLVRNCGSQFRPMIWSQNWNPLGDEALCTDPDISECPYIVQFPDVSMVTYLQKRTLSRLYVMISFKRNKCQCSNRDICPKSEHRIRLQFYDGPWIDTAIGKSCSDPFYEETITDQAGFVFCREDYET
jgi:hypothetical protein